MTHSINYHFKGLITTSFIIKQAMFYSTVITKFIKDEISNSFVFNPCDFNALVNYLLNCEEISNIDRSVFMEKFKRDKKNQ